MENLLSTGHKLLDVRTEAECKANTATSATNMPLATLLTHLDQLDK